MPITGPSRSLWIVLCAALVCFAGPAYCEEPPAWMPVISKLASALSQSDASAAVALFDSGMADYGAIQANIQALSAQTDVLCAIDVIEDNTKGGSHALDLDWFMQLSSRADNGPTERRRQRVRLEIREVRGRWKIVSLSPVGILDPIHIN